MAASQLTFAELEPVLARGTPEEVVALFAGRSEAERRAVAPAVWRWCTGGDSVGGQLRNLIDRSGVATPALLACTSKSELKRLPLRWLKLGDAAFQVLVDRRPEWAATFVESILTFSRPGWLPSPWPFCRRLVLADVCAPPEHDAYIVGMVQGEGGPAQLKMWLLSDPGLLEYEVWRIFEVDCRPGSGWSTVLPALADDGLLSRERLLDVTLDALGRDFSAYSAGWFQEVHENVAPTPEEQAARVDRYLHLLGSGVSTTVKLALRALEGLEERGELPCAVYAPAAELAVAGGPKVTARAALRLLDRVASREASDVTSVVSTAVVALGHPNVDVQRAALKILAGLVQPEDLQARAALLGALEMVAPSLRRELEDLVGLDVTAVTEEGTDRSIPDEEELRARALRLSDPDRRLAGVDAALASFHAGLLPPPLTFSRLEAQVLTAANAVEPIQDVGQLVEVLTSLVEECRSGDEIERALDGISRLCADDLSGTATAPLRKRVTGIGRGSGSNVALRAIVEAWLTGQAEGRYTPLSGPGWFNAVRAWDVALRAAQRKAAPLLAAPTHIGGWIDPAVVPARLRALAAIGVEPTASDAYQALLRLGPCRDQGVIEELRRHRTQLAETIRFALGDPDARLNPTSTLWPAANQRRTHEPADLERQAYPGAVPWRSEPDYRDPSYLAWHHWYYPTTEWTMRRVAIRWVAIVSPMATESFFAIGTGSVIRLLDESPALGVDAFLDPMLDPDVPFGPSAARLLAVALSAKDPQVRSLAIDAVVALVTDGRLDVVELSRQLHELLHAAVVSTTRLGPALADAARASTTTAVLVAAVIEELLSGDASEPPRQLHHLLQLLLEISTEQGIAVTSPTARSYLTALKAASPSSKQGRLAKQLLTLTAAGSGAVPAATLDFLRARVERAERWEAARR